MSVILELVSPARVLLSEKADMVVVPGEEGDFGVLPGHAPIISALRPGLLAVFVDNQVKSRFFVAGGFASVSQDKCSVLVDSADNLADLDEAAVAQEISNRQDDLKAASDEQQHVAEQALQIASAKLDTLKSPTY